jgi:transposase-like protein
MVDQHARRRSRLSQPLGIIVTMRRTYTAEEKQRALELYETDGPRAVEAELGIPKATVVGWAQANGVRTRSIETKQERVQASMLTMAERKVNLASGLMDDIERLRTQLWQPCVERKPLVVSDGAQLGSRVEIVDVELKQPTFGDQRSIMTSIAIAVDKVQILTGDVTSRTETVGTLERPVAEERLGTILELASKRVA